MKLSGSWVTMLTPFQEDGQVDFDAIPTLVDFYAESCDGIFAVCQSSEMFFLSLDERVRLGEAVLREARGRLPVVVSGHVANDFNEQLSEIEAMSRLGADAVVLVVNRLASPDEDDNIWLRRLEQVLDRFPSEPFGMYECPYPYPRLLSDEAVRYIAKTGRFSFVKDTCCCRERLNRRLDLLRCSPVQLFNANTATLLETAKAGAGYSGVMANFHPELYRWLVKHAGDEPVRASRLHAYLTALSWIEAKAYPACAKRHLHEKGLPIRDYCRNGAHARITTDLADDLHAIRLIEQEMKALTELT